MDKAREILEQAAGSLTIEAKLADATIMAICPDNSVYWMKTIRVRPPIDVVEYPIEQVAEWLQRRIENGGEILPDWSISSPRKS